MRSRIQVSIQTTDGCNIKKWKHQTGPSAWGSRNLLAGGCDILPDSVMISIIPFFWVITCMRKTLWNRYLGIFTSGPGPIKIVKDSLAELSLALL